MFRRKTRPRLRSSNGPSSFCGDKRIVVVIRTTLALLLAALVVLHQRLLLHQTSTTLLSSLEGSDHHRFLNYDNSTSEASAGSEAVVDAAALMSGQSSKAAPTMTTTPGTVAQRIGPNRQQSSVSGKDNDEEDVWLTMDDLDVYLDAFSDSWYMSLETFLETDRTRMQEIEAVEEACFVMFEDREESVRMALDWLDFGVEHMSKWWKVLDAPVNEYAHNRVLHYLDQYVNERIRSIRRDDLSNSVRPLLRPTVALVAFQQCTVRGTLDDNVLRRSRLLTVSSLSATIASLLQAGVGRIVVVGHDTQKDAERSLVNQAFSRFAPSNTNNNASIVERLTVGGMQLAYVTVPDDMVRTDFMAVNVPRGALLGLRRALEGTDPAWTSQWLGPNNSGSFHPWKYVYLTEPDTILHARPASFAGIERMLRKGMILVPHRLQPVPYEGDVPESNQTHTFITRDQLDMSASPNILELDVAAASSVACCDEQMGTLRPGPKAAAATGLGGLCGWDRWWLCGFDHHNSSQPHQGNHSLILDHYQLIRLRQGTGVTLISGSSHGRRCFPTLHGTCTRRMRPPTQQALVRPKNPWITPKRLQERRARNLNASVISTV